jgi:hypothetical protein
MFLCRENFKYIKCDGGSYSLDRLDLNHSIVWRKNLLHFLLKCPTHLSMYLVDQSCTYRYSTFLQESVQQKSIEALFQSIILYTPCHTSFLQCLNKKVKLIFQYTHFFKGVILQLFCRYLSCHYSSHHASHTKNLATFNHAVLWQCRYKFQYSHVLSYNYKEKKILSNRI